MRTLVVNPGSSSVKISVLEDGEVALDRSIDRPGEDAEDLIGMAQEAGELQAIAVRFVHGGPHHTAPVVVDEAVLAELDAVASLAPLHNPVASAAARVLLREHPDIPLIACFDTAFHTSMPAAATTYALPHEWNERWQLRRYGFHGLSHEWASGRAARLVGRPTESLRMVVCHLGGGASLCAVRGGESVDTTMGFTPMAGLVMQTRSGSVDPGLVLHLLQHEGVPIDLLGRVLDRESGLRGLSGTSGDMREVVEAMERGDQAASAAFDVYIHRLSSEIGSMVVSTGGLDVLVFTGGVGEHSPRVRAAAAERLAHLGVELDVAANDALIGEGAIGVRGAAASSVVVTSREDLQMESQVHAVLGWGPG